jgi:pimeloyl-ACP methyl ester carboxylesterase
MEPLRIADMGHFFVGGRRAQVEGRPVQELQLVPGSPPARADMNGEYLVGSLYVEHVRPDPMTRPCPLLFWHGGGLTGACWDTTPDGREGWKLWFLRRGWHVHVSDAVERGRSGYAPFPEIFPGPPLHRRINDPWEQFRIGPSHAARAAHPGHQFPLDHYEDFVRQGVPRFTGTDPDILAGYLALLARTGPSVIIGHSQGGHFACAAAQAVPHLVRALVLLEPSGFGSGPMPDLPILLLYGDHIARDPRWITLREAGGAFAARTPRAELRDLPAEGLAGNGHMLMLERNSDAIAALAQGWMESRL